MDIVVYHMLFAEYIKIIKWLPPLTYGVKSHKIFLC